MTTGDATYNAALRPRITIKTIDGDDTLYTYDSFSGSNPISVTYCDVESAVGESGTFNLRVSDNQNLITSDGLRNCKVYIELGKSSATYHMYMIGFGDTFRVDRPITNQQDYLITGFGSAIQASQLFIHRRETYKKGESDAKIYNIIDNALTKRLWRPLKKQDESIQDITGWLSDGISTDVNTEYRVLNKPFTYFSDLCNDLCDITGAVWFIDFNDAGEEIFTLSYNSALQTPIIIKSGDLMDRINDDGAKTSYIKSAFGVDDNSTTEAGVATRLFTTTIADKQKIVELEDGTGSTNLTFKAIAQQVIIDNDARRIESIELRLSKDGDPSSPNDRVNGDIVLDNGSNSPTGTILDEFHISIGSIEDRADWIETEVDISPSKLDVAQSRIWIRLFQRSNEETVDGDPDGNGNPNHGTKHTIKWHHSNAFNATQPYYSGTANEGDSEKKSTLTWNVANQGPVYTVRINSNIRRLFSRTNKVASTRLRLREQFIPTDFLSDPQDVIRYLSLNLSQSSKGRRGVADFQVTIPNNFLFKPHQFINFSDGLSDIADTLKVQRARYVMGSSPGDPQIGTLDCNLTLSGLYNTLLQACSCT